MSDNVPEHSPPVRKISHQINFITGVNFPNKAAHKMTLAKNEELNKQDQELLRK